MSVNRFKQYHLAEALGTNSAEISYQMKVDMTEKQQDEMIKALKEHYHVG